MPSIPIEEPIFLDEADLEPVTADAQEALDAFDPSQALAQVTADEAPQSVEAEALAPPIPLHRARARPVGREAKIALLEELLARIQARRRPPPPSA